MNSGEATETSPTEAQDQKVGGIPPEVIEKVIEKVYEMLRRDMAVEQERWRLSKQKRSRR